MSREALNETPSVFCCWRAGKNQGRDLNKSAYNGRMMGLFREVRSHLGLLLVLAVALGGLFFLFELFGGLTSDGPRDLLTTKDAADSSASEIPSGAGLIAVVAPAMSILLGLAALFLLKRRFKDREGRRWTAWCCLVEQWRWVCWARAFTYSFPRYSVRGLPFGGVDYGDHPVKTEGVAPLGLTLLAAFVVTVGLVAVTKPKLLPIPLLAWLTAALVFGMFGSDAIYGVNLFKHHSVSGDDARLHGCLERLLASRNRDH